MKIKQAEDSIFLLLTTLWNIIFYVFTLSSSESNGCDDKMPLSEPRFCSFC